MNARQNDFRDSERAQQKYDAFTDHPFRVGEFYANRQGEYEVVEIAPPKMTVRFSDDRLLVAEIAILARIWDNLSLPAERPELEPKPRPVAAKAQTPPVRAGSAPAARAKAAPAPQGLAEADFTTGSRRPAAWRTRLGPLMAARLSELSGIPHNSFPVTGHPELYLGREHHFNGKLPEHRAKFLLRLTPEEVVYGFHVERHSRKMDLTWDWLRFIAALEHADEWGGQVVAAMRSQGLAAEAQSFGTRSREDNAAPGHVGRWTAEEDGLRWSPSGEPAGAPCGWGDVAAALTAVDSSLGCDFYVLGRTRKDEAIAMGDGIVERVAQVCAALVPLYTAGVR